MSGEGLIANAAPPHRPWYERYVSNVSEARRHLERRGMAVHRLSNPLYPLTPNVWKLSGYSGLFDDGQLMVLAEHHGWDGRE